MDDRCQVRVCTVAFCCPLQRCVAPGPRPPDVSSLSRCCSWRAAASHPHRPLCVSSLFSFLSRRVAGQKICYSEFSCPLFPYMVINVAARPLLSLGARRVHEPCRRRRRSPFTSIFGSEFNKNGREGREGGERDRERERGRAGMNGGELPSEKPLCAGQAAECRSKQQQHGRFTY